MRSTLPLALAALVAALPAQDSRASQPTLATQRKMTFETGRVVVGRNLATIDLPAGMRYLQAADARHVVEAIWNNPPDERTIGLVVPPDAPGADPDKDSWAIIVSYEEDGHVDDADAAKLDYDEILATMKKDALESNAERRRSGYETVRILGWAEPPHYDRVEKKIYWAKNLEFGRDRDNQLNYDVRILTRKGVLVMQALGEPLQLAEIAKGCKAVLAATTVSAGQRYEDFDPGLDKVAAYGIGGLIAGKLLAKAGMLKLLLKPLLAFGAVVAIVLVRLFGKKKPTSAGASAAE